MEGMNFKVVEGLLILSAFVVFAIWQFRSIRRDRAELERRRAERQKQREES